MNEVDEQGWGNIHHAAFKGYLKSAERFIKADNDLLEVETKDELRSTPLLLAVMSGNKSMVECLIELGARIHAIDSQNHGVVELCAFKKQVDILQYFIELENDKLPVWKQLIKFMSSDTDEEAEAGAECLKILTTSKKQEETPQQIPFLNEVIQYGIVPAISKVMKSTIGEEAKSGVLEVLLNILSDDRVKEQAMATGLMDPLVKHLRANTDKLIQLTAKTMKQLCNVKQYADQAVQKGAIPALIKDIQNVKDPPTLVQVCDAIGVICEVNPAHQSAIGNTPDSIKALVNLYEEIKDKQVQLALTRNISKIAIENEANQNAFVAEEITDHLLPLIQAETHRQNELKMTAVTAISKLAEKNPNTQRAILEAGYVKPLLYILKRSRQMEQQEKIAGALWSLAGENMEERCAMGLAIGVITLNEFLTQQSEDLHYIGSEALGVLAQGPDSKVDEIYKNNGVANSVRLLRSDKEYIVLSVIRTLRYLSVRVGYKPHYDTQHTIAQTRGIKYLVALMVHSRNQLIQVEAAYCLACVSLGNKANLDEIQQNMDFSYIRVLKMMYNQDSMVRLLAGAALAAFAYNNVANQKEIADQGGVLFRCFQPFLETEDEFYRANAAFQVVVLAKIIPDQEQAISCAAGIKLLVDLLQSSKSDKIQALTSDFVARLVHTRAGVPAAFVSIDCINHLCDLMESPIPHVHGNAAIACRYLSFDSKACRQLLKRCRLSPYLMEVMQQYTVNTKLNPDFMDGWKHCKYIGLPPIEEDKYLVNRKTFTHLEELARPNTNSERDLLSTNLYEGTNTDGERNSLTSRASRASKPTIGDIVSREASLLGSQQSLKIST